MTIEQTVEIPENHRVFFDIPRYIPSGKAKVALTVTPEQPSVSVGTVEVNRYAAIEELKGLAQRMGSTLTLDRFMEMQREDSELENEIDGRLWGNK